MSVRSTVSRWLCDEVWQRRALMGMAGVMAVTYLVGILWTAGLHGSFVKGDARSYFAFLPSIVLDRDIDLRNQFAVLQPEGNTEYPFGVGREGRARTPFPIAPALLWLPGYLIGIVFDSSFGSLISDNRPLGYGFAAMLGTAVWSILLVGVAAEVTRKLVRECLGQDEAFLAVAMAWLATSALYYTAISPLYSHAPAWLAVSLMLWLTWRAAQQSDRIGWWVLSGFAAGWVVAIRLQDVALLAVPVVVLIGTVHRVDSLSRSLRVSTAWAGAAALGYLPQALTEYWLHGSWVALSGVDVFKSPRLSELAGVLFSSGYRGWISWTPIVLPGLVGLGLLAKRAGTPTARWFAFSGIVGIAGLLVLDVMNPFGAGAAFGARRYVSATPLLALGLGAFLGETVGRRVRSIALILLPALTVWNVWVLVSYELLIVRHGIYPSLLQAVRYAVGLGVS